MVVAVVRYFFDCYLNLATTVGFVSKCAGPLHLSRLGRFLLLVELHWFVCQKHTGVFHLKHDNATRIKAFDLNRECLGVHVYTVPSEEYLKEK